MSEFSRLDESKATLRLLIELLRAKFYGGTPTKRIEFINAARQWGVGRSAFYSSLEVLKDLGLMVEKTSIESGRRVVFTELTEKGTLVARYLIKIMESLN